MEPLGSERGVQELPGTPREAPSGKKCEDCGPTPSRKVPPGRFWSYFRTFVDAFTRMLFSIFCDIRLRLDIEYRIYKTENLKEVIGHSI